MRTFFAFVLIAGALLFGGPASAALVNEYRANGTWQGATYVTPWYRNSTTAANEAFSIIEAYQPARNSTCTPNPFGSQGNTYAVTKDGTWGGIPYKFNSSRTVYSESAGCAPTVYNYGPFSITLETRQVENCPTGNSLSKDFFYAWATDNVDNPANIVQSTVVTPPALWCDGTCSYGLSEVTDATVDVQPSPNNFYAVHADVLYVGTGSECSTLSTPPDPSQPPDGGTGTGGTGGGDGTGDGGTGDGTGDGTGTGDTGGTGGTGDTGGTGGTGDTGGTGGGGGGGTGGTGGNDTPPTQEVDENGNPIGGSGGTGTTDPNDPSGGGTGGTGGDGLGDMLCDAFPTIFACQKMGGAGGPTAVPDREIGVSVITPTTAFGPTPDSSCPSPTTIQTVAGPVSWDWDGFCQFADGIRPVILALAWLSAGLSTFLFLRR